MHRGSPEAGQDRLGARRRLQADRRDPGPVLGDDPRRGHVAHDLCRGHVRCTTRRRGACGSSSPGSHIHLADFSIIGRLNYRNDNEPNDGIVGAGCADSSISNVWLEHTKVGIWIYNGVNLVIEGCRFRDLIADGVNLCVGTSGTVIENCTARGTGDDCFAIWPAASDQGFVGQGPQTGKQRDSPLHGPAHVPRKWRRDLRRGQQPDRGLPLHRHRHRVRHPHQHDISHLR